jgi:hypothetical protein
VTGWPGAGLNDANGMPGFSGVAHGRGGVNLAVLPRAVDVPLAGPGCGSVGPPGTLATGEQESSAVAKARYPQPDEDCYAECHEAQSAGPDGELRCICERISAENEAPDAEPEDMSGREWGLA